MLGQGNSPSRPMTPFSATAATVISSIAITFRSLATQSTIVRLGVDPVAFVFWFRQRGILQGQSRIVIAVQRLDVAPLALGSGDSDAILPDVDSFGRHE
jgi:hypothetical protein